jgi:hypothetical protein
MLAVILGLGVAAVIAGACSLGGIDSDYGQIDAGPQPTPAQVQACSALANARCAALGVCNDSAQILSTWGDLATCEERLAQQCEYNLIAPGTGATVATTQACTQKIPGLDCAWVNNPSHFYLEPEVCDPVDGGVAVGRPCFTSAQCQSGYCAVPANARCGTCAPTPHASDPCVDTEACGYGTNLGCLKQACVVPLEAGASCAMNGTTLCGLGLACTTVDAGPEAGSTDVCVAEGTVAGQLCAHQDLGYPTCNNGLYCVNGACAAVTYADAGGACGMLEADAAPTQCTVSGACVGGQCVLAVGDGQRCTAAAGAASCIPPARCVLSTGSTEGTCALVGSTQCP